MRLQEIKKTRIVIASLLKPVDDTRMFEKLGQTLAEDAEVYIIGYASRIIPHQRNIEFHSLPPFKRISIKRILAPFNVLGLVLKKRPDVFIITTHELLWIGILSKILCSCRLVYDVQENYGRNLFYTDAFPLLLRPFIAIYVRLKEWLTAPFINHFLLAERGYEKELPFLGNRSTIIENKTKQTDTLVKKKNDGLIHLLFTGTLAETTGVFTAIGLAQQLHGLDPSVRLTIIGYCSLKPTLEKIRSVIAESDFIQLIGGDQLIPHAEIVQQIQSAHFGIIAYEMNPSTVNSIPTKLYEYLGYQLPILLVDHEPWIEKAKHYSAALQFNMSTLEPKELLRQMKNTVFYTTIPRDVFWDSEAEKLKKVMMML